MNVYLVSCQEQISVGFLSNNYPLPKKCFRQKHSCFIDDAFCA